MGTQARDNACMWPMHDYPLDEMLCALSAAQLLNVFARGEATPTEVTQATLRRIDRLNPERNVFITVSRDIAMSAAKECEVRWQQGRARPLEGLPFSVKDLVNTAGVRTTMGSQLFADNVPANDAVAIARLRAAGAVLLGKTTTPEFGHKPFTDAPLFGRTANAWSAAHTCGGSSGGAAVAVMLGMGPLAVATDGGGSTRIPAACNGAVGIKPTAGVIAHSQTPDPFGNYTYVTPMTRTVRDTRLMMAAMAGTHWSDPWSYVAPQSFTGVPPADLEGLRIGVVTYLGNTQVAASAQGALDNARAALQACGAHVMSLDVDLEPLEPLWRVINHATWRARFGDIVREHGARMTGTLVQQVESASEYTAVDFQQASFARGALFRRVQTWFDDCDIVMTPTLTRGAVPIDNNLFDGLDIDGTHYDEIRSAWYPYTMPFNLSGHPAISVPVAVQGEPLPLAVQFVGRFHEDVRMLDVAELLEATLAST
jgi:aspartyl-tRNA(Asn)/glutamyl-tRNA(Gln) amidotransferase subunit A